MGGDRLRASRQPGEAAVSSHSANRHHPFRRQDVRAAPRCYPTLLPGGTHRRTGEVPAGPISGRNSPSARQNHLAHRVPRAPSVPVRSAERLFGFFGANGKFYGGRCRAARGLIAAARRGLSQRLHRQTGFEGWHGPGRSCLSGRRGLGAHRRSNLTRETLPKTTGPGNCTWRLPRSRSSMPEACVDRHAA